MSYVIVAIVIALVLSPIFWVMPSPRQKRQMLLRQRAMALGLQVKVCDLPQNHRAKVRKERPEQGVVYRLPWRSPDANGESFNYLSLRNEQLADTPPAAVKELMLTALEAMAEPVVALEFNGSGLAVYWRENGSVELVEQIVEHLKSLRQDLSAVQQ